MADSTTVIFSDAMRVRLKLAGTVHRGPLRNVRNSADADLVAMRALPRTEMPAFLAQLRTIATQERSNAARDAEINEMARALPPHPDAPPAKKLAPTDSECEGVRSSLLPARRKEELERRFQDMLQQKHYVIAVAIQDEIKSLDRMQATRKLELQQQFDEKLAQKIMLALPRSKSI